VEAPRDRPRTAVTDIVAQASRAVVGRRTRTILTVVGIALGVSATVATLGIAATASGSISDKFDATRATLVTMRFGDTGKRPDSAASQRVQVLHGVIDAGFICRAKQDVRISRVPSEVAGNLGSRASSFAAEPDALTALGVTWLSGRVFDAGHDMRGDAVAVVETSLASRIAVSPGGPLTIWIDGNAVDVLGTFSAPPEQGQLVGSVIVPYRGCRTTTADGPFRAPDAMIRTDLGAANQVAEEARLTLAPEDMSAYEALVPPDLNSFRSGVEGDSKALLLGLTVVSLAVGALGVSNTTLTSVMERRQEIGLRRALGASRRVVACQFLTESAILGVVGGVVGTVVGLNITAAVAVWRHWLLVFEPWLVIVGPLLGLVVGLVAGMYPSWAAARVAPSQSLRST
jgi:putative ABC transport system permease protein